MKKWKTLGLLGLIVLMLAIFGLVFGCSDKGSGEGGKTAKGYQVKYWFEKDEHEIARAKQAVEYYEAQSKQRGGFVPGDVLYASDLANARERLEKTIKDRNLNVEVRGPATDLIVMIVGQDGSAVATEKIEKEEMMDNIEVETFYRIFGDYHIKPGDYFLVVKTLEPEKLIYKTAIKLPPAD